LQWQCERLGSYIGPATDIGVNFDGRHNLIGVFIADNAKIGSNVTVYHHVTIGASARVPGKPRFSPIIADNVFIGANATIIGSCKIGEGARIGAGVTLVDIEVPAGATIVNKSAYNLTSRRHVYSQ
jgi:serine O-acetyltransferase